MTANKRSLVNPIVPGCCGVGRLSGVQQRLYNVELCVLLLLLTAGRGGSDYRQRRRQRPVRVGEVAANRRARELIVVSL